MANKIYQITLTPVGWYFFGGEITFGGSDKTNYYAKSNLFPQESAILGMLRYEILKKKNLLNFPQEEEESTHSVKKAVGLKGFDYTQREQNEPMGAIHRISPIMIQHEAEILCRAPFHAGMSVSFNEPEEPPFVYLNNSKAKLPIIKNFAYGSDQWVSLANGVVVESIKEKVIFNRKAKIGITKKNSERDSENKDGLYKSELCTLNKGYKFVFFVELDTSLVELDSKLLVSLGAERSMFKMETIEKVVEPGKPNLTFFEKLWEHITIRENELYFLSDAFVPETIYSLCEFAWTDTITFRNITRSWKGGRNYASLSKQEERSDRYNLLKRGSVLFFAPEKRAEIEAAIKNEYLNRFGYNIYKIKN